MTALPVATSKQVHAYARRLILRYPRQLAAALLLHALAAGVGLVVPRLLGNLVEEVRRGEDQIGGLVLLIGGSFLLQALVLVLAMYASARLGERVLAELREEFVVNLLALPLGTVELAGAGDLVTRTTRDVDVLARTVRLAVPDSLISLMTVLLTLGAIALLDPLLVLPCLVAVPLLLPATWWYLSRARGGYLRANASYSQLAEGLSETVKGAPTVEALGLADRRSKRVNLDIEESYAAERYTLRLRSIYLPIADIAYLTPVVATLVAGGLLYIRGAVSIGAATAATLYVLRVIEPLDRLLYWLDELQVGGASLARLLGVGQPASEDQPPSSGADTAPTPHHQDICLRGVSFAYHSGRDVLHHVDLDIRQGERLAVVGPSGAGKSTLGRLIAGIHLPGSGTVTIGGVPITDLPLQELRKQMALVTQEHHVFGGSLRDNLLIAKSDAGDEELERVLRVVQAWDWAEELGFDADLRSLGTPLEPAQAQQLALARLVLADPHTLILDEATALLDPSAARRLEASLAAVLEGRTVIAIAHRLHTARDADRVVVMREGHVEEVGSHDELLVSGGTYAALWTSWHGSHRRSRRSLDADTRTAPAGRAADASARRTPPPTAAPGTARPRPPTHGPAARGPAGRPAPPTAPTTRPGRSGLPPTTG